MTDPAQAKSLKLQADGEEIASILIENILATADREGRPVVPLDYTAASLALLTASWIIAKAAALQTGADEDSAKLAYAEYLRSTADGIAAEVADGAG